MSKAHPPELKKFMDKKLSLKLNGGRHVQGILRGFDPFMNLVIDECVEMATSGQQNNIGMVEQTFLHSLGHNGMTTKEVFDVCQQDPDFESVFTQHRTIYLVIRGNSIIMLEALERV
uniref:Small nuclear ribonucleoprotein G n=1 Tax=Rhinolophus ferrumequinum TaxID=59479 RepID=A0A671FD29_RHIFE